MTSAVSLICKTERKSKTHFFKKKLTLQTPCLHSQQSVRKLMRGQHMTVPKILTNRITAIFLPRPESCAREDTERNGGSSKTV